MHHSILPNQLAAALDEAPSGIQTLSLDCFDTLIWRHVHVPTDVFADLGASGPTRHQRVWSESHARSRTQVRNGSNEATIHQVYEALLPNHTPDERAAAVAAELEAEARHCYAFAPTVALMKEAKRRGLDVIIVSDTYLNQAELSALIGKAAGNEVLELIDRVFCSSDFGVSKSGGLFRHILDTLGVDPSTILHIGDNKAADLTGAQAAGINGLHLVQFGDLDAQRFRLEAAAGAMVNGGGAVEAPNYQPHRAPIALAVPDLKDDALALGYTTLGPVLHSFSRWLIEEAAALEQHGGRTHLLFLMRDGYLPMRVFGTVPSSSNLSAKAVEVSRFTATASSFVDEEAILAYLEVEAESSDLESVAKQLLFNKGETAALLRKLPVTRRASAFVHAIRTPANIRKIIGRSRDFGERLVRYLHREVAPAPGDRVVLVDLGYNGTVQDRLEPLLRRALGVEVAGRYLLLRETRIGGLDKRGFLDGRHYSPMTLDALCANVAVVEQLCTNAQGSVVDYDAEGRPVRAGNSIKGRQSDVRERIQEGCIRYAAEQDAAFVRRPASEVTDTRRQATSAILARLMFLPLPQELAVLAAFEHDVNLGTDGTVGLFDPEIADRGLKRRGLFYMKGASRMYLPAELRGQGFALSLALLTQRRFGLDLKYADFCDRTIDLPIIVADGNEVFVDSTKAYPTHDGYFMAAIPIGPSRFSIGVQFGRLFEWVQVESAQFIEVDAFLADDPGKRARPIDALPSLESMEQIAPHLMRCDDESAFMMVPPPPAGETPLMLTIAFRPIAARIPVAAPEAISILNQVAGAVR